MNTVQNGKGDRPRNNWSANWYTRYDAVDWRRHPIKPESQAHEEAAVMRFNGKRYQDANISKAKDPVLKTDLSPESIRS
jgi:hypothetical protein